MRTRRFASGLTQGPFAAAGVVGTDLRDAEKRRDEHAVVSTRWQPPHRLKLANGRRGFVQTQERARSQERHFDSFACVARLESAERAKSLVELGLKKEPFRLCKSVRGVPLDAGDGTGFQSTSQFPNLLTNAKAQ